MTNRKKVTKRKRLSMWTYALIAAVLLVGLVSLVYSDSQFHSPMPLSTTNEQQMTAPSMTTPTSQSATPWLDSEPQFHCEVAYAYVGKGNPSATHKQFGVTMYPKSQYPCIIYFNTTHVSNTETESCDVKMEVYLIQIATDKGTTENYTYIEGTNYKFSNPDSNILEALAAHVKDLVDVKTINGRGGHFKINWTTNTPSLGGFVGSLGAYTSKPSESSLCKAGDPNLISVSIKRIGWIVANGSSISTFANNARNENIEQIQLQKFGDGFIYNKIVPSDKLLRMNPFEPAIPQNDAEES